MSSFWIYVLAAVVCVGVVCPLLTLHYYYGIRLRFIDLSCIGDSKDTTAHAKKTTAQKYLTILSHNVWCIFFIGGSNRQQRLKIFANSVKKDMPDIICLQEMTIFSVWPFLCCADFLFIQRELYALGYKYHTNPKLKLPLFGSGTGIVTFSKYPIINDYMHVFKAQRGEFLLCKGFNACFVQIPKSLSTQQNGIKSKNGQKTPKKRSISSRRTMNAHDKRFQAQLMANDGQMHHICVINVHLENKMRDVKCKQIVSIIEDRYLKKQLLSNCEFLLCMGDFNACSNYSFPDNKFYDFICKKFKRIHLNTDLFSKTDRTYRSQCDRDPRKRKAWKTIHESLDHMFVNDALRKCLQNTMIVDYKHPSTNEFASDHFGILSTFNLSNA